MIVHEITYALGAEPEFYSVMQNSECTLKNHVLIIMASRLFFLENGSFKIVPWDEKGVPDVIEDHRIIQGTIADTEYPSGI
nr:F-box protein At1g78280 [Tanacetum cinerariifolium]